MMPDNKLVEHLSKLIADKEEKIQEILEEKIKLEEELKNTQNDLRHVREINVKLLNKQKDGKEV
jgi:hypothetical protein